MSIDHTPLTGARLLFPTRETWVAVSRERERDSRCALFLGRKALTLKDEMNDRRHGLPVIMNGNNDVTSTSHALLQHYQSWFEQQALQIERKAGEDLTECDCETMTTTTTTREQRGRRFWSLDSRSRVDS